MTERSGPSPSSCLLQVPLTGQHIELLFAQLLAALSHMHEQGVVHRDVKPANCLVNGDCRLRVADFGMARALLSDEDDAAEMTDYVVSRWYRPPEILLGARRGSDVACTAPGGLATAAPSPSALLRAVRAFEGRLATLRARV